MDFEFTTDQHSLRDVVARLAREQVAPVSRQIDREGQLPPGLLAALADAGLLSLAVAPEFGGGGASSVDLGIAVEELARADFVVAQLPIMGALTATAIAQAEPELRDEVLPILLDGSALVSFALTEPDGGSDAAQLRCRARRTDGGFVLNGDKTSISNIGTARGIIVLAGLEGAPGKGVTAFYVPRNAPGVHTALFNDLGCRGLSRGSAAFVDVFVPAANQIGEPGRGFNLVMGIFDLTRALIALAAVGTALQAVEDAAAYSRHRRSMGKVLAAHQGVSFRLAEHLTTLTAARWLCYRALWLRDANQPHTTEAAMVKWWAVKASVDAIHASMLIHGHAGYTDELPQQQRLRDVMGMEWGDGTAEIQKLVIARALIGPLDPA